MVSTSGTGTNAVSSSDDVETSSSRRRRVSTRARRQNRVTNVSSLGDISQTSRIFRDVCNMLADCGGARDTTPEEERDPGSTQEALAGPHGREWKDSIHVENEAVKLRDVFRVVKRPKGAHLLSCKYLIVFTR